MIKLVDVSAKPFFITDPKTRQINSVMDHVLPLVKLEARIAKISHFPRIS